MNCYQHSLPNHLEPLPGESLNGFIVRVCQENWLSRISALEQMASLTIPKIALEQGGLDRLAALLGIDRGKLEALQYSPVREGSSLRQFMGEEVHQAHLRTAEMWYCPQCLGTKGFHKAIWDLRLIEVCLEHRTRLISRHPNSGDIISWRRPDLLADRNGELPVADTYSIGIHPHALLRSSNTDGKVLPGAGNGGRASDLEEISLLGQYALYEKCGLVLTGPSILERLPCELRTLSLDEFVTLLVLVGAIRLKLDKIPGARRLYFQDLDILMLTSAGVEMLQEWPMSLFKCLDELQGNCGKEGTGRALSKVFEKLFRRMRKLDEGAAKEVLQEAIAEYLIERDISLNPKNAHFVKGNARLRWRYVTLQEATEMLGVTPHRARGIALDQGWIEPGKKTTHEANLIPRKLVEDYGRPEQVIYTRGEALKVLGISETALESIVKANLLQRLPNDHDGRSVSMYRKCEVDGLLERLRVISEEGSSSEGAKEIDLHQLMCEIAPPRHSFGFLLEKVIVGAIKPIGWDAGVCGLYAMKFDGGRIVEYRSAVSATLPAAIRVTRATRSFGFSISELAWLVNEGFVRIAKAADTFRRSYLNRADLEAFTRTHVLENKVDLNELNEKVTVVVDSPEFGRIFRIG